MNQNDKQLLQIKLRESLNQNYELQSLVSLFRLYSIKVIFIKYL